MAAYTAQQLADLRAALATGALSVDTPNMRTTFRSLAEMRELESIIASDVSGSTVRRSSITSYCKD